MISFCSLIQTVDKERAFHVGSKWFLLATPYTLTPYAEVALIQHHGKAKTQRFCELSLWRLSANVTKERVNHPFWETVAEALVALVSVWPWKMTGRSPEVQQSLLVMSAASAAVCICVPQRWAWSWGALWTHSVSDGFGPCTSEWGSREEPGWAGHWLCWLRRPLSLGGSESPDCDGTWS